MISDPEIVQVGDAGRLHEAHEAFLTAMVGLASVPLPDPGAIHEPGRLWAAVVDGEVVGGAESYPSWLVVPGGARVSHAMVTHVGVLPTHRRRGLARALLTRQLQEVAERGEVVASLRASQGVLYERYGYGIATWFASTELDAGVRLRVRDDGPLRLIDAEEEAETLPRVAEASRWVGAIGRPIQWWAYRRAVEAARPGPRYVAVHGPRGGEDGFVVYRPASTPWFDTQERALQVDDLVAHTPQALAALLEHVTSLDLVRSVRFMGPVDDTIARLLVDVRGVHVRSVVDETWLRLVDVDATLTARTYGPGEPVTIGVRDDVLPRNVAAWRITPDGASRTDAEPDLVTDVATLACTYLGATRWRALHASGRVEAADPGVLTRADRLFATDSTPFCGTFF